MRPPMRPRVLLIEPDGLVRSTVASICRELQLVRVQQATSTLQGEKYLKTSSDDGLLISVSEGESALALVLRLRAGEFRSKANIPVVVMAPAADVDLIARLKELDVRRMLLQPFRLRDVVHTVEQLWPLPQALAA